MTGPPAGEPTGLRAALQALPTLGPSAAPSALLQALVDRGLGELPLPGGGATLARWQALAEVAGHDLSLAKLFEGHADALAILRELGHADAGPPGATWGVWAAEPPDAKVVIAACAGADADAVAGADPGDRAAAPSTERVELRGRKAWCSGADTLSHALLTAWRADGTGPFLVKVALRQAGVEVNADGWAAVGMAGSASLAVRFDGAIGERVGAAGAYLARPGFWQGGIGIAACWHGGALLLGRALHEAVARRGHGDGALLGRIALGRVDLALQRSAVLLRDAARWVDARPQADASALALRCRLGAEDSVRTVLDEVGRVLGATPFCRDPRFARMAADLPVYVRQSHGDRDFAALGERVASAGAGPWSL